MENQTKGCSTEKDLYNSVYHVKQHLYFQLIHVLFHLHLQASLQTSNSELNMQYILVNHMEMHFWSVFSLQESKGGFCKFYALVNHFEIQKQQSSPLFSPNALLFFSVFLFSSESFMRFGHNSHIMFVLATVTNFVSQTATQQQDTKF